MKQPAKPPATMAADPERRHDLDWLRVLATATVLFFHTARFFDTHGWHVKNPEQSAAMMAFVAILVQWMMPLFFIISAMSTAYILRRHSNWRYLRDRALRLLLPFALGTFVVLIPVQVWIERVTNGQFEGGFWAFYPHYFEGWYAFGGNFAWMGLHLWYLEFLFIFSLMALPLFRLIQRAPGATAALAMLCARPGGILVLGIPLAGIELLVNRDPQGIGMREFGGWSLATYLVFFALGFLLATDGGFRQALERHRIPALIVGLVAMWSQVSWAWSGTAAIPHYALQQTVRSLNAWLWLVAILGFASRYLTRPSNFVRHANEGVLPFYALHQTVIVALAYVMLDWAVAIPIKYVALLCSSLALILAIYLGGIRPWAPMRLLFGMKARRARVSSA